MSRKKRFIKDLTEQDLKDLEEGRKYGKTYQFRDRCHCIILSNLGYRIKDLANLFNITRQTISSWLRAWEKQGIKGLKNKSGQGRKPVLVLEMVLIDMDTKIS